MDKKQLKVLVKNLCNIGLIMSNIGLFVCCILVFIGILNKDVYMVIFILQMFVFFMFGVHFSSYFKDYLD
ncbi:hypothetical protein G9F71_000835 [Clostridium sp. FP2]|uniref:hypothetical protein n=1 Tax=Clostridium sp. FP2 TaxID=2724481 RepID=UPI0013E998F8|nr:hypothetical protein [Clostridium sp. FP2]MBZ9621437.1 hypothetical protein [Clostridium sp. FP2]